MKAVAGVCSVAIAVILMLFCSSATAKPQGAWQLPAQDLSGTKKLAEVPQIAIAPDGTATATWWRSSADTFEPGQTFVLQAATRPPGGSFGPAVDVSAPSRDPFGGSHIAIAPDGTAIAVWGSTDPATQDTSIQAATRPPGGSFDSPVTVSDSGPGENVYFPFIAIDGDSNATVGWIRIAPANVRSVQVATRPAGGSFGPSAEVTNNLDFYGTVQIVIAPDGTAIAIFERDAGSEAVLQAAVRPPGGSFGIPEDISGYAGRSHAAVGPDGTVTVLFTDVGATTSTVMAVTRPPAGSFGPPVPVSPETGYSREIAFASDGTATAVWAHYDATEKITVLRASTRPPGGEFGASVDLSPAGDSGDFPSLAVAPDDTATVVFNHLAEGPDGPSGPKVINVQAVTRPPGGSFGAPVDLSVLGEIRDPAGGLPLDEPQVAIGPDGTATAIWSRYSGIPENKSTVQSASTEQAVPTPPPSAGKAKLKFKKVKPKKPVVKRGKKVKLKVTVKNTGSAAAKNVKLCLKISKGVKKRLKPKGKTCQKLGSLGTGKAKTRAFKLKATRKAKKGKKYKVSFKLSAKGARSTKRAVKVKVR